MKKFKNSLIIMLGTVFCAVAANLFYSPNKIVCGGISGVAVILYHTLSVPLSVSLLIMNAVLFASAFFAIGTKRLVDCIFGTVCYIFFTELFSKFPPATDNLMLATIFGGAIDGIGMAFVFIGGGSTGGNDLLARIVKLKIKHIEVGKLIFAIDIVVLASSLIIFKKIELTLFGIIMLYICTYVIDEVINRMNISKLAIVVSDKTPEICDMLIKDFSRGVTLLDGVGGYSGMEKYVLICALKNKEMPILRQKIDSVDKGAFVIFLEAKYVYGEGFKVYPESLECI